METAVIPSRDANKRILTFRKPNGVYACITPWNFPTLIPVELIAPGIAAGNTIVMKPSEWTPLAMANFMQIMADAGLPDGVVNVVYGGGEVGELLVTHPGIDCIGFVGSHVTAEKIARAAGLKRSLIEASGNGPVIVREDADLARAAQGAVFGGFFCAGQVCCATQRVLVHESVRPRLPLSGSEGRRLRLPELRPGHDRPGRKLECAAVFEQRRAEHAVLAPDEMRGLATHVRPAPASRPRRAASARA